MAVTNYHTANGRVISQNSTKNGYQYLLQDPLGNVIATVDDKGTKSNDTTYWPFGEVRSGGVSSVTNFGFCGGWGYYTDSSSKLYVRARYYRPGLGRWQTVDPLWPNERSYKYCVDMPVVFGDPSGLSVKLCKGTIVKAIADHWLLIIDTPFCSKTRLEYSWDGILINGCDNYLAKWRCPDVSLDDRNREGPKDRCTELPTTPVQEWCLCNIINELHTSPGLDVIGGRRWRRSYATPPQLGSGDEYNFISHNCQDFVNAVLKSCGISQCETDLKRNVHFLMPITNLIPW